MPFLRQSPGRPPSSDGDRWGTEAPRDPGLPRSSSLLRVAALLAFVAIGPGAPPAHAAPKPPAGQLLIATDRIQDPQFRHTVILLIQRGTDGVAGLILNRRTDITLASVFPAAKDREALVFLGGPLPFGARALVRAEAAPKGAETVLAGVHSVASERELNKLVESSSIFRMYAGYCGWTESQLQGEIDRGYWVLRNHASADTIFDAHPETLWDRMGGGSILKAGLEPERPAIR